MQEETFDFIIVGAGSAGSVLAHRLSEDRKARVLVLEYGGSDASVLIRMPSALSYPMGMARYDWGFQGEPEQNLDGRVLHVPRGKVIGGSSSINGLVYVRGNPLDFDRWRDLGAAGWAYADVLPYFKRAETRMAGGDVYRGSRGPLPTRYGSLRNPLYSAFVAAGKETGYPETEDINGYQQEGFGRLDMTVDRFGRRASTARVYLKPAVRRGNVKVVTHALATGVILEGKRATGVRYLHRGAERIARATREVIVAAGAIGSPHLLKLSGIGPAAELKQHGIAVAHDLAGVGENLQDHLEFYFQFAATQPITLYSSTGLLGKALVGARWLFLGNGIGASNQFETGGFIRSRAGIEYPDIQYHFLPLAVSYDGSALATEHSFQAHVGPMRSASRGTVRLRSADAREHPRIHFNYMSRPEDWQEMRACVRLTREIFGQKAFDPYRGREISPGAQVRSDAAIDAFIRRRVESAYHASCTCRMGAADDPGAVVDAEARVHGIAGLRVVDASIMPSITNGNLNAPTIMIAEKCADHILGRGPLPALDAATYVAPNWRTAQR
jgi:choline dehydrogenase